MTHIFVNIPTNDLERAKSFYTSLGATINPTFTDENGACIVWDENVFFMVLTREFFATFTDKEVCDPKTHSMALLSLSRESRAAVDQAVEAGIAAGGTELNEAKDYGFMYSRAIEDPDGNGIDFLFMEPAAVEQGPEAYLAEQGATV
ncbi:VOC family protein [Aestuariimicrobium soli]|uniref:VOC family protein n=1 Tax=Aestuariimicrobium soli TaxID=2035834 RepID=UPI003EC0A0A1